MTLIFIPVELRECVCVDREDGTPLGQIRMNPIRYLPYGYPSPATAVSEDELQEIADEMERARKGGER